MKNTTLKMMMIAITGLFLVSLNNVAHAEKKYYKSVLECVSWDYTVPTVRVMKNNCGFGIAVWFCDQKSKRHCGNSDYYERFNFLDWIKPYGSKAIPVPTKHRLRYFACGADGVEDLWHIDGNTPNSNRFRCFLS